MAILGILLSLFAFLWPPQPRAVLHDWDARRSAAWVAEDPAALRELYVPGSRAGEYDEALLLDYRRRGLDIRALETQVLSAAVLAQEPNRLVLRVTDRVARLEVVRDGEVVRLPRDQARTRILELRLVDGIWRVASVSA